jgi:transcriptional regulator with XRE-family HTH domain
MEMTQIRELISELLKLMRGENTQQELNQQFGFNFNQIYRWESNVTKISWQEFVKLCQYCKKDLNRALTHISKNVLAANPLDLAKFFEGLMGNMTLIEFSEKINVPRKSLSKWIKGESEPPLEDMFAIFHHSIGGLFPFCQELVDAGNLNSIKIEYQKYKIREHITLKYPVVSLILNYMHSSDYKGIKQVEKEHFRIIFSLGEEESEIFDALEASGVIHRVEGKFEMRSYDIFRVTGKDEDVEKRYMYFFMLLANSLKKYGIRDEKNLFTHMVYSTNKETKDKIHAVIRKAQSDISQLLNQPEASKGCQGVSLTLFGAIDVELNPVKNNQ